MWEPGWGLSGATFVLRGPRVAALEGVARSLVAKTWGASDRQRGVSGARVGLSHGAWSWVAQDAVCPALQPVTALTPMRAETWRSWWQCHDNGHRDGQM